MISGLHRVTMFSEAMRIVKHNPASVFVFNKLLEFMCRSVEAYIFVANPGRSGSATLSRIFEQVDGGVSLHEPPPNMFNDYPRGTDRNKYFRDLFFSKKRFYINAAAMKRRYYFETNHQFIKNFVDPAVEYFRDKIKIIHLVRDPVSVASSFYKMNDIPGSSGRGKLYLIDPAEDTNLIKAADLLGTKEFEHDLYKCLWYWYEVEARTQAAKVRYPNIPFHYLETNDLNDRNKVMELFKKLSIVIDVDRIDGAIGVKTNLRTNEKVNKIERKVCEEMNQKLLFQLEKRYGKAFWQNEAPR